MLWPSLLGYFTWNLIKDPYHEVVVCGIPKNGITSLRALLNSRCDRSTLCRPCRGQRCAEFKFNNKWSLKGQKLVALFRDPFARLLSAYHDRLSNNYIRDDLPCGGVNLTFAEFVDHVHANWRRVSKNEHFTPQTKLCQPERQKYFFVGTNEDTEYVYMHLLGATHILRLNAASKNTTATAANLTKISQMYRADYQFLKRL